MKIKNLIALLTVFENFFITVEQKVLFEKKNIQWIYMESFFYR